MSNQLSLFPIIYFSCDVRENARHFFDQIDVVSLTSTRRIRLKSMRRSCHVRNSFYQRHVILVSIYSNIHCSHGKKNDVNLILSIATTFGIPLRYSSTDSLNMRRQYSRFPSWWFWIISLSYYTCSKWQLEFRCRSCDLEKKSFILV